MIQYASGLVISKDKSCVLLIRKEKPEWQKGKLNIPGGKIEETDECPKWACRREVREETGLDISTWTLFCVLGSENFKVSFYVTYTDELYDAISAETEEVNIIQISDLKYENVIPNIKWLIPMALSFDEGESCKFFEVTER